MQVFDIDIISLFPVIAMLKLTKYHEIERNNSFRLQLFSTNTWYSAVNQSNINRKAFQIGSLEKKI